MGRLCETLELKPSNYFVKINTSSHQKRKQQLHEAEMLHKEPQEIEKWS